MSVLEANQVPSGGGSNMVGDSTGYSFRQKEENRWIWEPNANDQVLSCQKDYQESSVFFIFFISLKNNYLLLKVLYIVLFFPSHWPPPACPYPPPWPSPPHCLYLHFNFQEPFWGVKTAGELKLRLSMPPGSKAAPSAGWQIPRALSKHLLLFPLQGAQKSNAPPLAAPCPQAPKVPTAQLWCLMSPDS